MKKLILFVLAVMSMAYGQTTSFIPMGGINDQTANYLVVATDVGKIVRMNCASCTVTLPSVPPYLRWSVFISNINSSALTVSPNGVLLDGSTSSLSLLQNQSVWISTDGTLYGTVRGGQSGTTSASDQSVLFSQIGTVSGDGLFTYDYINKVIGWPAPFVATTSWPGTPLSPPGAGKTTFGPDSDGTFKTCVGTNPCTAPGSASFPDGTTLAPGLPATLHPELGLAIVLSKIAYPITNVARATNVVTITVSTPNTGLNWPVNGTISTFGLTTPYDVLNCVRCTLLSVTGGTPTSTFTYTLAGADVGSAAATGSASIYETQLTGYGVAMTRFDSTSNNPAERGTLRLSHNDAAEMRNQAHTDDCWLIGGVAGVDEVQVGGQCAGFLGTYHPGYIRMLEQAAPANPAASNADLFIDSTTHQFTCRNSSGTSCLATGGGTVTANSGSVGAITYYAAAGGSTTVNPATNTTYDNTNSDFNIAQGTLATSNPLITHTATWNAGAVVFTNLTSNVTCTAAAANSVGLQLQVGGVTQLGFQYGGANCTNPVLILPAGGATVPSLIFGSGASMGFYACTTGQICIAQGTSNPMITIVSGKLQMGNGQAFSWASTAASNGSVDTGISRDAAKIVDVGNGTQGDFSGTINAADHRVSSANASTEDFQASACEATFGITTLSTVATTTDTTNNCLPVNAVIDSVVYRITTTITTAASFTVGDATTAARFCGTQSTLTAGTTGTCFVQADQTGAAGPRQTAAAKVRVTTNVNPGAGAIRLIVYYHTWTAPTS